jgi:hypothetical protein
VSIASAGSRQADLGSLLAGAVRAVVEAQDVLDAHASDRAAAFAAEPQGGLALPPLWFAFDSVAIDIELSAEVAHVSGPDGGPDAVRLLCRMLNPVTAGLFGYAAATGTRVRVELAPQRLRAQTAPRKEAPPSPT